MKFEGYAESRFHNLDWFSDVCVSVHHIWNWREIPTWCNNLFIIINNSTCFGHLYAHLQEYYVVYVLYYSIRCSSLFSTSTYTHSPATHTPTPIQRLTHTPTPHTCTIHIQPLRQPTKAQFSFIVLNTICSSIQRIQPNTPEDGHIDARNM